ncbi:MAG: tyrosine-type recombinase/integrase [Alphaproteobacteria bacterium]|nr:tyrosine-type recombinase/integrase [Alphaproteobacteria bacterium]
MRNLTEPYIRNLKPAAPGQRYAVADAVVPGLKVRVTDKGSKSFILWRRYPGAKNSAAARSLGKVGELTLADARAKARAWLALLAQGKDPSVADVASATTFGAAVEDYLARHVKGQRKARDAEREIRNELLAHWARRPLNEITRSDVIRLIDKIVERPAPGHARNIFGHIRTFFNWAVEHGLVEASPADRVRSVRLIGPKVPRQRVLTDTEIQEFWRAAERVPYPYGPMYRMLLLTGQRRGEVAGARWGEIDLVAKTWTVPPERFKSNSVHVVPLTDDVLALLAALPRWQNCDALFSNDGRVPVNNFSIARKTLNKALSKEPDWVIHDLRRTVRTRLSSLRVPDAVAEMVIGHGRKGIQRVYDQHQYLDEMREALRAWAGRLRSIVDPPPQNVVAIAERRS